MMQKQVDPRDAQPAVVKPEDGDEIDLLGIARTLWRGKHWIALCAVLALTGGWYKANVASTALFTATAEMALEVESTPLLDISAVVSGFSGDEASINTEMAIVRSGDLIGRLVDQLQLEEDPEFNVYLPDPDYSPGLITRLRETISGALPGEQNNEEAEPLPSAQEQRQDLIDVVRGAFDTESSWDTYVFSISATTTDPEKSQLLANTLAELYRDDQIRLKVEATERAATWLSGRVGELRAELDERQNGISDLRARSSLVSAESFEALNAQSIELRTNLERVHSQLVQLDERAAELRAAASNDIEAKLAAADDSQLEAAAAQLAASEPGAQLRFDRRFSQLLLQTEAERERAQEQIEEQQRIVDDLSRQFESQSADFQALQQLEQEAEATQVLYETFLNRLKETTIQGSIHEADSRILTDARVGEQVAPRSSRIMAMALMLGILLGAGFVLLREFLQNTIRTTEELEQHTGRPVLGQFPRVPARSRPDTIEYLLNKPTSAAAEAIRNLRTSILLSNVDLPPKVIMVTSSVPNEGKTTLTIALAQNLAGLNKRVLLIEGDIRRRTFQAYFPDLSGQHGLISAIAGRSSLSEAVVQPDRLGIDVLLGEQRSAINAADLFSSERFQSLLETARAQYDYVIIDTPPVLVVPDARVIAQQTDAVVYVVHWDHTTKSQVDEGLRQFRSVNIPVTGLVLSRVDPKGMKRYGYGGRYGAYSRYGRNYYET